jgi:hypothetical protein
MIDWINTFLTGSVYVCAPLCWYCLFILLRQMRRWQQLNALMTHLAIQAYMHRHLPIWVAWSRMTGLEFHINLDDVREKQP